MRGGKIPPMAGEGGGEICLTRTHGGQPVGAHQKKKRRRKSNTG